MSIITSVFHIYGFLITEEAANLILRYTEEVFLIYTKSFLMQNHSLPFRNIFVRNMMATVMAMPSL